MTAAPGRPQLWPEIRVLMLSTLLVSGTSEREIGDLAISTYHGYFGYNWGDADATVRPASTSLG